MNFYDAWSDMSDQNTTLKRVNTLLSLSVIALTVLCFYLLQKDPLVIEKSELTTNLINASNSKKHTQKEIENFLKVALEERYNSQFTSENSLYFSQNEFHKLQTDKKTLRKNNMIQYVYVRGYERFNENKIVVDVDRIISVNKIRSAFSLRLNVQISSINRSRHNPYGLEISKITLMETNKNIEGNK